MSELHTHQLLTDESGTETIEPEETIISDEKPHEIAEKTFADYNVRADIVESLADAGITHPFPIQAMTLPVALAGHDIIGQAKTGTGKTLGFGIPALQRVVGRDDAGFDKLAVPGAPQALVIVPTRELAVQVAKDLENAARKRNARIATIYGGRAYEPQVEALQNGVEVVVGTPGRLIDLYKQKHLSLKNVKIVILDEADEMLDLGFLPDVETLIAGTPAVRQTLLFSATMPGPVIAMARRYMTQPTHIRAADPDDEGLTKRDIRQLIYRAHSMDKVEVVARILQARGRGRTIIFTKTKRTAAKVAEELVDRGFAAAAIHGDLGQGAREQALRAFRNNKVDVLVATDVAARGIDVDDVTHVINYQCVEDEKIYLHRVGRTGRAGNKGTAVTFVDWDDMPRWGLINKALGLSYPEPVETYSSSPHLFEELDIPEGTKGRLPRDKRVLAGVDAEVLEDLGETGKKNSAHQRKGQRTRRQPQRRPRRRPRRQPPAAATAHARAAAPAARLAPQRRRSRRTLRRPPSPSRRGRCRQRRPPPADRARTAAAAAPAKAPTEVDRATRARRRTRTRRRNGEVVAGGDATAERRRGLIPSMTDTVWAPDGSNLVVHADNAEYLPTLPDGAFTLIYVDPPFNTGRVQRRQETRMVLNAGGEGDRVGFKGRSYDTIKGALHRYDDAFSDYWSFLEPRLVEAWRLLADDGTLYLHLDYREVHYAKVMLDAIFGRECFLNEIIWAYDYGARAKYRWPTKHDNILVYVKNPAKYHFDSAEVDREPYMAPGLVTPAKRELGKLPTDVWWHTIVSPTGKEKTGYPTQKPEGLIRRVVAASSRPGDWCLDFFAGSGTLGVRGRETGPQVRVRGPEPAGHRRHGQAPGRAGAVHVVPDAARSPDPLRYHLWRLFEALKTAAK